jgi:hypothetical protein
MAESGLGEIDNEPGPVAYSPATQVNDAGPVTGSDRLVRLGTAYLAFTAAHTLRWRALFERCSLMSRSY